MGAMRFLTIILLLAGFQMVRAAESPNILLIVTDEHNFRTLGCYRDHLPKEQAEMWGPGVVVQTPHIDRLAREGVICTRAYATAPVCSPCRAAMITGLYPQNTGVPTNNYKLRTDIPTLASILNKSGYETGFIGKWHLGGAGKPEWSPEIDGGFVDKQYMFNRGHWKKFELTKTGAEVAAHDKKGVPSYSLDNADEKTFSTDFLTDRCIDFITAKENKPFLAVISYPDPHGPNTVRAPYDGMFDHLRFLPPRTYGRDDVVGPKWLGDEKGHTTFKADPMRQYFGMVKCLDDNIGRLFQTLEANGKLDSTIIMMTSDHGDLCYEHDRLNKGNPYEGSARVPMLIRFPDSLPAGFVYEQPVGTVDITPTLLRLAGNNASAWGYFQGRDLSEDFHRGVSGEMTKHTFLRNAGTKASWICVVDSRYKLVLSVNDRPWLFDSQQDPDELHNFFGRPGSEAVTRDLAKALKSYSIASGDTFAEQPTIAKSLDLCLQVGL